MIAPFGDRPFGPDGDRDREAAERGSRGEQGVRRARQTVVFDSFRAGGMRTVVMGLELAARSDRVYGVTVAGRRRPRPEDEEERDDDAKEV